MKLCVLNLCHALRVHFTGLALLLPAVLISAAVSQDLGNGFRRHGVASPFSNHRGTVATIDGEGHDVVLSWLFDYRGGYALLLVDCVTGKSEEYPVPFPPEGDVPFASILSEKNKYYAYFNSWFTEFDPVRRAFTFTKKTMPQKAMSMTEDDKGRIWSATFPKSGIVSFDPETREFRDYGYVYNQEWSQYPRALATDEAGWVYFGIGFTKSQIVALEPQTGKAIPLIPEEKRLRGQPELIRDLDGKVYGQFVKNDKGNCPNPKGCLSDWYMLFKGQMTLSDKRGASHPKPIITGDQNLFHREFPNGLRLKSLDLIEKKIVINDPKMGTEKIFPIAYSSEGASITGVVTASNGTISGGTMFPMRLFSYDPRKDTWTNHPTYRQYNAMCNLGNHFYIGGYPDGFLMEWDPTKIFISTNPGKADSNPLYLTKAEPDIDRPYRVLCHPDGKTIIMSGTPGYGLTGGGLLFWDQTTKMSRTVSHLEILPEHSTTAMVALPKGKILAGTTVAPGTGGVEKAIEAEIFLLDMATKKVDWHKAILPGVKQYTDLCLGPKGLVYGFADQDRFFVFDPVSRQVIHEESTRLSFGRVIFYQQGPRVFVSGLKDAIYILFLKGIAKVDPETYKIVLLAESPVPITAGGDYFDGRIYYSSNSNLYSYAVH